MIDLQPAMSMTPEQPLEQPPDPAEKYWAKAPADKIGAEIMQRVEKYQDRMESRGEYDRMRRSYLGWYGESLRGARSSDLSFGGKNGELVLSKANVFRAIGRQMLSLVTKHRPSFNTRAINTDFESQAQATTFDGIAEFYMRRELERAINETTETGFVMQEGYLRMRWDTDAGEEYGVHPETGQVQMTGDVVSDTLTPFDVIKDPRRKYGKWDWVIARDFRNKYDLATKHPELADKLIALDGMDAWEHSVSGEPEEGETDDVPVYEFYHRKTPALPKGRHVIVASGDCVLFDGPLPYDRLPVLRLSPSDRIGTSSGYTDLYDCLGPQEILDAVLTSIVSNFDAHSVQNIHAVKGTTIANDALPGGGHVWYTNPGDEKPGAVNLVKLPEGWDKLMPMVESLMTKQVGSNDVARGDPSSVTSGAMAAVFVQSAIEFSGDLEYDRTRLIEDALDLLMSISKAYAHAERMVEIVGDDQEYMMQAWSAKDIAGAARVIVDTGNAMQRTVPGRMTLAEKFVELKGNTDLYNGFVEVVTTGKLEPITGRAKRQRMLIRAENKLLAKGPPVTMQPMMGPDGMPLIDPITGQPVTEPAGVEGVPVTLADFHPDHLMEHYGVLDDPAARQDPKAIEAVYAHCDEHLKVWREAPPALLQALGIPPYPADMAPPGMAPSGPPPDAEGAPDAMEEPSEGPLPEPAPDPLGRDGKQEEAA